MDHLQSVGGVRLSQTSNISATNTSAAFRPAAPSAIKPGRRVYLSLTGVAVKLDVSVRTAHKIVNEPWFPSPVQLFNSDRGHRRWIEQEIDDAIATRAPRATKKSEPDHLRLARERKGSEAVR